MMGKEKINSPSLVAVYCGICGNVFRLPTTVVNNTSKNSGIGLNSHHKLDTISSDKFYPPRKEMNTIFNEIVPTEKRNVTIEMSWDVHADNIDICPLCALIVLRESLGMEILKHQKLKEKIDALSTNLVTPFKPEI